MAVQNCNSKNPFLDSANTLQAEPDLLWVANKGVALVAGLTKYLSTLPHPIEVVEELVAVCAVTSNLLTTLHATLSRFTHLTLSSTHSFIRPLCHDVMFAFKLLGSKVEEAKHMRVFEPNDIGLVRLPRAAWVLVMGTEAKAAALRSRLYVEKYRVRVLIEAVSWECLRSLETRTATQEQEFRGLDRMLPLIAERLIGVQKDYVPRLKGLLPQGLAPPSPAPVPSVEKQEIRPEPAKPAPALEEQEQKQSIAPQREYANKKVPQHISRKLGSSSTISLASTTSTSSSASSTTAFDDSILESWLLRHNPLRCTPKHTSTFLSIPIHKTYTITAASYYVKPVSSCLSEIRDLQRSCWGEKTEAEHRKEFKSKVLRMEDDAQWEVQRLIEARENASSGEGVRRVWEVVAGMERPRRGISTSKKPRFGKKKEPAEWVLILKGTTVDHRYRTMPDKHLDPWNPMPAQQAPRTTTPASAVKQIQSQQQVSTVLRHVENRPAMAAEEARTKMEEIARDLFVTRET